MCDVRRASQRLAPILRALSNSSNAGLLNKRNALQIERRLASQASWPVEEKANYKWLRAAEPWEAEMDAWNRIHTRYGIACMTINSKYPIPEEMWKAALKHIHSQTLMMRLNMVMRGDTKWLCESNMEPDVQLLENQTITEASNKLFEEGIDDSPLKIRILVAKPDDLCLLPSIKKDFPYQYYFLYFFNHGISDGQSVAMVYKRLWETLEDILEGRNYMERLPIGKYTTGEELNELKTNMKTKLINNPDIVHKEMEILESSIKTPLLNEIFALPENSEVGTKFAHYVLDGDVHQSFLAKCKSKGIKISSGTEAAINTAIVEMVKDAGLCKDSYHLSVMQNVDMRRYIENNPLSAMGFFGGRIHQSYLLNSETRENFWDHCKEVESGTAQLLKSGGPILQDGVRQLTLKPFVVKDNRGPEQMEWDYTFNNVLDLSPMLFTTGPIQITDIMPINMTHNFIPFQIMLHTFRGIVRLSISYSTNCMSDDMANELMERVLNVIRDMALS